MITFIKVQAASIVGSMADYLVTILLVTIFDFWYMFANVTGNITGGTLQFILNRKWVFKAADEKVQVQVWKFILVFAGNLLLSAMGVFILTAYLHFHYLISKTIVSVLLGVTYNYILQKKFVFHR
jgi:putative flippase GtrA